MTTLEERVSRLEGGYEHLATKADVADLRGDVRELRGEMASLKWTLALGVGAAAAGLAALQILLKYLG